VPLVVGQQARLPHPLEDTGRGPLLEAVMSRGAWAEPRGVQGLPLAAGAQDEEDGLHADAVGGARPAAAEAVRVFMFGQQLRDAVPEVVRDVPLVHDGHIHKTGVVHGYTSCMQLPRNNVSCAQ
jgi:hypothetical protein